MDLEQAGRFVTHLRLAGIEATYRAWGKSKTWVAINIGGMEFLWNAEGDYDGWEWYAGDKSAEDIRRMMSHVKGQSGVQKPDTEASDG